MPGRTLREATLRQRCLIILLSTSAFLAGCEHINLTHYSQLEKQAAPEQSESDQAHKPSSNNDWKISNSGWWQRMMQESLKIGPYTISNYRPGWINENSSYPSATEVRRETVQALTFDLQGPQQTLAVECEYRSIEQGSQGRRSVGGLAAKTIRDAQSIEQNLHCQANQQSLWSWQWSDETQWTGSGSGLEAGPQSTGMHFTSGSTAKLALWNQSQSLVTWQAPNPNRSQQQTVASAIAALMLSGQAGE